MNAMSLFESDEYKTLLREIRQGKVVVFVGAGVSCAAGLPSWRDVTKRLAAELVPYDQHQQEELINDLGPYGIFEVYASENSPRDFDEAVGKALRPSHRLNLKAHSLILDIPFHLIITTNWDDLFERAAEGTRNDPLFAVTRDEQLRGCFAGQGPLLIKPHGSLGGPTVAAQSHVYTFEAMHPGLSVFLQSLFFTHRLLFVGYSFGDPDFLRWYHLFAHYLDKYATQEWAKPFILCIGDERRRRLWENMHFKVLDATLGEKESRTSALLSVLTDLRDRTTHHVEKEKRAGRIAEFLEDTGLSTAELRVRAGLSPLGIPDDSDDARSCAPWQAPEYRAQQQLRAAFARCLSGREVHLILSTDFESLQQRALNPNWARLCLQRLIAFFSTDRAADQIYVVDRRGPYEMQQYIVGDRAMVESRKLGVFDAVYHDARIEMNQRVVRQAVEVFDSCFVSFVLSNLENLLSDQVGRGRDCLASEVWKTRTDLAVNEAEFEKRVLAVAAGGSSERLFADAVGVCERLKNARTLEDLAEMLSHESPFVLMLLLGIDAFKTPIRMHLLQLWERDLERLAQSRSAHLLIQLTDASGVVNGYLDKAQYHLHLLGHQHEQGEEPQFWNMHVAGFFLTSDGRRLVLRRRIKDAQHFDEWKWDRTISGHVRMHSTFKEEIVAEIGHHLGERLSQCEFARDLDEFRKFGVARRFRKGRERSTPLLVQLSDTPVGHLFRKGHCDGLQCIYEPVKTLPFLGILPRDDVLCVEPGNKHCDGWLQITLPEASRLLRGMRVRCKKGRVVPAELEGSEISAEMVTTEGLALLPLVLDSLRGKRKR